ncbi:MAG: PQQ-binding-like beta-propeller repeat protein [Chthoniobacterales bacterium]
MKEKLFEILLKVGVVVFVLFVGTAVWYYTLGRKPKLVLSTSIADKKSTPAAHLLGPGEMILLAGGKATLYDTAAGKEKWSTNLEAARPTPAPTPKATPAAAVEPTLVSNTQHDPAVQLLQTRLDRQTAKVQKWAAELNAKRNKLDTPLKLAAFKEEEAKYQAAVVEARDAAEALRRSGSAAGGASTAMLPSRFAPEQEDNYFESARAEVFTEGTTVCVLQARSLRLLDRGNGRLTKEVPLPGGYSKILHGPGCLYVLGSGGPAGMQVTRIDLREGAAKMVSLAGATSRSHFASSRDPDAGIETQRTAFDADGSELAQMDVRLKERNVTGRQTVKGDSASDWEEADKKTTGGSGADAAVFAQALANDAAREVNGGKEYVDESTYEIVLRRPFNEATAPGTPITVQGRPEIFSSASYDLVAAGRKLIAFDHANKKLWESTLGYPIGGSGYVAEIGDKGAGTMTQPCLEDDKRLYLFDSGFLTAFDRGTGATLWRLPSVGIHKIQLDHGGSVDRGEVIYVTSANESAETLKYSRQATGGGPPLILKVDATTGKLLWKAEKFDQCFVSGGSVYATLETRNGQDLVNSVFQGSKAITSRFKLYKLSARDGKPQWEWFQTRQPLFIAADGRKVSLLFGDELQVLSSIAL